MNALRLWEFTEFMALIEEIDSSREAAKARLQKGKKDAPAGMTRIV